MKSYLLKVISLLKIFRIKKTGTDNRRSFHFLKFLILVFSHIFILSSVATCDIVIIANKNVAEDSLSIEDIKRIFLGKKKKWKDNSPVTIAFNKTPSIHNDLLKKYVMRTPSQFKNTWRRLVFTGEGKYPLSFSSDMKMINFIGSKEGAIGYIDADQVNDKVKIIKPE